MAGSSYGTLFRFTTWGESHGAGLGVVIDGCPAGLPLSEEDIMPYMERRRPNGGRLSTKRNEADQIEILSGVFEGKTTGTPISMMVRNTDQHSRDYGNLASVYRPGHADYGYDAKFRFRDYRGGGRSSGRETLARVAAGAVACKALAELGISFDTKVTAIGGHPMGPEAEAYVDQCRSEKDSTGSEVICCVHGVPAGIGDPVFDKLDARLAQAIFSIGAVKGLDIGDGHLVSRARGSENNDSFRMVNGVVTPVTNHAGGILGGISTGADIVLHVYFKPTPSIARPQETITSGHEDTEIEIHGRHDPVIGPRAAVVVEAMTSATILDAMLINMSAKMDSVRKFYEK